MSSNVCAWGSRDEPCGEPTIGEDTLCPWHREHFEGEKKRLGWGVRTAPTLDVDATGERLVMRFL